MAGLRTEQDKFTQKELGEILASEESLVRGQYVLDVGEDKLVKLSQVKKYWINKRDFEQATGFKG